MKGVTKISDGIAGFKMILQVVLNYDIIYTCTRYSTRFSFNIIILCVYVLYVCTYVYLHLIYNIYYRFNTDNLCE